jgi:hypothetical protein
MSQKIKKEPFDRFLGTKIQLLNPLTMKRKELNELDIFGDKKQNAIMKSYKNKGFVLNDKDEEGLHMFFSPKCVPKGLTKLQVRRNINAYFKGKTKHKLSDYFGHRLEIFIDGKFRLGASFGGEAPKNPREFHKLLKELI